MDNLYILDWNSWLYVWFKIWGGQVVEWILICTDNRLWIFHGSHGEVQWITWTSACFWAWYRRSAFIPHRIIPNVWWSVLFKSGKRSGTMFLSQSCLKRFMSRWAKTDCTSSWWKSVTQLSAWECHAIGNRTVVDYTASIQQAPEEWRTASVTKRRSHDKAERASKGNAAQAAQSRWTSTKSKFGKIVQRSKITTLGYWRSQ